MQPRAASRRERLPDRALELLRAGLAEDVAVDSSRATDDERARNRQPAVVVENAAVRVAHVRIADPVTRQEGATVAGEVGRVDADERDPVSIALEGRLEARGLALARVAPRSPEVDDDDLPAQRREAQRAVTVQALQIEVDRHRPLAVRKLLRDVRSVVLDDLP